MKPDQPEFKQYYEIQYRDVKTPNEWQCFESTTRRTFDAFVEANAYVQRILERIKISKDANIHQTFCLEYRIVHCQVTTKTEVVKTFNVK